MSTPSQDVITRLRERYSELARERLESIESALDDLEIRPAERKPLSDLVHAFHGFAGTGLTYGFEEVTLLGKEGEALAQRLSSETGPIAPDQFRRLRELASLIRDTLDSEAPSLSPSDFVTLTPTIRKQGDDTKALIIGQPGLESKVARALEDHGIVVERSGTKDEAIERIDREIPDVLITDVQLGNDSGYEVVRHLRSHAEGERTAAFVVRSHEDFLDKVEAIRCGADGSFQEPLDENAVVRKVNMVLERMAPESPVILTVEDEPDQAEYVRLILESARYRVVTCSDPTEFEKALSQHDPDLLLMDVLLPNVSGYELARYVRQDEAHAALPILFLTTESQVEAVESIRSGADDVLLKPVSPTLLLTSVAARIERSRMLNHLLERDGLTGLLTHTAFIERLTVAMKERSRGDDRSCALVMLDIDHFKEVNDRYGHPAGDKILASLAGYLRRRLRQSDTLGRYGGEEFGVLLYDLEEDEAQRLFERMLEEFSSIEHPLAVGQSVRVEFSVGIAMLDLDRFTDVGVWIEAADSALYRAKDRGRARVETAE